ncbi:MAG TPA: rubredoxin [Clostridiales bacterium]|nr:MAG: rubredoxin [Clostridiales bacterium GWD2_32_59]HAN10193.1 rubredoxin [Clostridiales bacterium]
MARYICTVCGYEYNEEDGDADNDILEGTLFEDLPAEWTCPMCGVGKEDFEKDFDEEEDDDEE